MTYPAPIKMKTKYTFLPYALGSAMQVDGRSRILESQDMQKAMGHLGNGAYRNRAAYSYAQAVNNICQETDVPVYCRGILLDEVDRYKDACIIEGGNVYPSMNILISWLAKHYSSNASLRAPDEGKQVAYKRIRNAMKVKFAKNSSYQKGKLINDYERIIGEFQLGESKAGDAAAHEDYRETAAVPSGKTVQLSLF